MHSNHYVTALPLLSAESPLDPFLIIPIDQMGPDPSAGTCRTRCIEDPYCDSFKYCPPDMQTKTCDVQ